MKVNDFIQLMTQTTESLGVDSSQVNLLVGGRAEFDLTLTSKRSSSGGIVITHLDLIPRPSNIDPY